MLSEQYIRNATLCRVIDGDTLVLDIDLGFGIWKINQKVRVLGVNCPEMRGGSNESKAAGRDAKAFTQSWFDGRAITIRTVLEKVDIDSFGRVLAEVWQGGRSLGAELLAAKHAVPFKG
jgi:micrococcal nuclease